MTKWVRLKNQQGQLWDSRLDWGIKLDEIKQLPEDIPAGSITAERLRMGGLIECGPPSERDQNMFTTIALETVQVPVVNSAEPIEGTKLEAEQRLKSPEPSTKKKPQKRVISKRGKKS